MNIKRITKPLIVGICGASSSGKTFLAQQLQLVLSNSVILEMDHYFKDFSNHEEINLDMPSAVDFDLLLKHIEQLLTLEKIECPFYDKKSNKKTKKTITIHPRKIIILEGIFIFQHPKLRQLIDTKIYLDTWQLKCLFRRIKRDSFEEGQNLIELLKCYVKNIYPGYQKYICPLKQFGDIIFTNQNLYQMIDDIKFFLIKNNSSLDLFDESGF